MKQPNVIVIYTDDQGTLDAGCYGSADIETPAMDGLAARGIRFTQAYAHTVCCPSRAALLTGRCPQRCGVNDWCSNHTSDEKRTSMNRDEVTLASLLKDQGYSTGLIGKWHLGARPDNGPRAFGFDSFFGHRGGFIDNYRHMFLHASRGQPPFHDLWRDGEEIFADGHYFPDMVVREARLFLEQNREGPFFLYLPFNLPHYPYQPDSDLEEKYSGLAEPRGLYAAMVGTVDRRIGEVLQKVDELGLREETLILYMSDNGHSTEDYWNWGFNYGAHGGGGNTGKWRGAKSSFFEGGIRVPAIVSMPGRIPEGEVRDQVVTNMDLLPTVLEMCGGPESSRQIDGHSLWPVISDADAPTAHDRLVLQWQKRWMVREGDWKLFHSGIDTSGRHSGHPERERDLDQVFLANLADDEPEWANHASDNPEVVARLQGLYDTWAADVFS